MAETFTPSVIAVFDAGIQDCNYESISMFLSSLVDSTSVNTQRIGRPRLEQVLTEYAEMYIQPEEPKGFVAAEFAKEYCDLPYNGVTHVSYEDLQPYLAALEMEYKHEILSMLFTAFQPPFVAMVLLLPEEDLVFGQELVSKIKGVFGSLMKHTRFVFEFEHVSEIEAVKRAYEEISRLILADADFPFPASESFFLVLNRPPPLHENYLYLLMKEAMRSVLHSSNAGIVAFKDSTDTCMSLSSVPMHMMTVRGKRLEAFFESGFYEQVKILNMRMWEAALSQFVAFYRFPCEEDEVAPKTLTVIKWPFDDKMNSPTRGIDVAKARLESFIDRCEFDEVVDFLNRPRNFERNNEEEPCILSKKGTGIFGYDFDSPITMKPRPAPKWKPLNINTDVDDETKLMYFCVLHETVLLNVLASFGPAPDRLKSPAAILTCAIPPQNVALPALEFVCEVQKRGLRLCLEAAGHVAEHNRRMHNPHYRQSAFF